MIVIDTNILLRYLLQDDEKQSAQATRLIQGEEKVLVTDAALVETVWTLKGKKYQLTKSEIIETVLQLFQEAYLHFEDGQVVWKALSDFKNTKPLKGKEAGFADALIVCKGRSVIEKQKEVFNGSFTFDKAAQKLPGAKAPN
ncbi:type II toxin-antitoxin system VapC family toxin [Endozoicomonas sp. 8E]|uniref:PIN domain-containing protein n=1 Tax=Endozoicomonas sp. 8E TaxID=3035692 RepID=UPI00293944EE|nr:type II toxin-antitoxin system VapC family toxin [Endozoicomonas sp. 8E]WOG26809.1 type II toxin-antitoxin system VapC family toxin [Endozoicomonas sp. 8E]